MLSGQQQVSMQEAVLIVDNHNLVFCSDMITYVSLAQGQALQSETDKSQKKDLITVYRNREDKHYHLLLEQYFYCVFIDSTFTFNKQGKKKMHTDQHRILMPKGMICKPPYPVDYDYARGMLIMHKPWNKNNTLDKLMKNKERTIKEFCRMIDQKEVPTSVWAQYVTAMKYAGEKRLEVIVKDGVNHPNIEDKDNDEETDKRMTAWIHGCHLTDKKLLNENMNNIMVDIGKKQRLVNQRL
jgi:hypothetical protein